MSVRLDTRPTLHEIEPDGPGYVWGVLIPLAVAALVLFGWAVASVLSGWLG